MNYVIELLERKLTDEEIYYSTHIQINGASKSSNDAFLASRTLASQRIPELSKALKILKHVRDNGNGVISHLKLEE